MEKHLSGGDCPDIERQTASTAHSGRFQTKNSKSEEKESDCKKGEETER